MNNRTSHPIDIIFAGDYHTYGPFDAFIRQKPHHALFSKDLAGLVSSSDLSIFNLEDPITETKQGAIKAGPYGVGSEESLLPISKAGFRLATFATNHTYDMKDKGIEDTIAYCRKHNIAVTGAGIDYENARKPYYTTIKNTKIAILNFARTEFNTANQDHGGANPLNTIDNVNDIKDAKQKADFVIVVVHEGVDVFNLPYPGLVKQMRFYVDMGADAIVLHHSRIISGYEVHNDTPIFYGIGNLLHLSKNQHEHKGLLVKLVLQENKKIEFDLVPVKLNPQTVHVSLSESKEKEQTLQEVNRLSAIIQSDDRLQTEWENHVRSKKALYLSVLQGHPRIFYRVAKKLKLLTWYERLLMINKKKYLAKWNIIKCSAHFEALNAVLNDIFKEKTK